MLLACSRFAHAQIDSLNKASECIEKGDLLRARNLMDGVVQHPETRTMIYAWGLRASVYKELYKKDPSGVTASEFRGKAVESYKQALKLDSSGKDENNEVFRKNLKFLASSYYNENLVLLDPDNKNASYSKAKENYEKFKDITLFADPYFDMKQKEIEFNNALGSYCDKLFATNRKTNKDFFQKAIDAYGRVIQLDPDNWGANYNLGMLYYNYGVSLVYYDLPVDTDLVALDRIQENSRKLFKSAEPYVLKANQLNPKRKEPVKALIAIYFSLIEDAKKDFYQKMLDAMEKEGGK